jgi:hypothetical protein
MKTAFIEKGVSRDGKPTGLLLNEFGGVVVGGLIEEVRAFATKCGLEVEREFDPQEGRPEFKRRRQGIEKPAGLSETGEKAYEAIVSVLKRFKATNTGGCTVFYSPKEWADRDESYGRDSHLIVVYDGGDHRGAFEPEGRADMALHKAMTKALDEIGVYVEPCTCWYGAVYS